MWMRKTSLSNGSLATGGDQNKMNMRLNQEIAGGLPGNITEVPGKKLFRLPEKVLQFGTGVLLRALPDYFIDKANKLGLFNGRIVVVKSTGRNNNDFSAQDNLYTVCVRGLEKGNIITENIVNASISRVLHAQTEWQTILDCARNPELGIIVSNTTEVGLQLVDEDINSSPPASFPGKLLAFLYERFIHFKGSAESGMIIIPTELVTDNGSVLKQILLQLAEMNKLDAVFKNWLVEKNVFCNSLVDRIVPGKPPREEWEKLCAGLGYRDELLTMCEPFRLWAIEGDERVKRKLSFAGADNGMKIVPDISLFKELKLRLLNGTHTFNCGLAYLSGFEITREAYGHPVYSRYARQLMFEEIAPAIPYAIEETVKNEFAAQVYERFCNPFIDHQWQSIATQFSSKMKLRNIPLLVRHYELQDQPPPCMALGFAAYLLFMKAVNKRNNRYYGIRNEAEYEIIDESAGYFYDIWGKKDPSIVADIVMRDKKLWDIDLATFPGFYEIVNAFLQKIIENGALKAISAAMGKKLKTDEAKSFTDTPIR